MKNHNQTKCNFLIKWPKKYKDVGKDTKLENYLTDISIFFQWIEDNRFKMKPKNIVRLTIQEIK